MTKERLIACPTGAAITPLSISTRPTTPRADQGSLLVPRQTTPRSRRPTTEVWGLSPQGPKSKAAFRAKYGLPFTLLSDEDHSVAEAFGSWGEKVNYGKSYMGIIRSSFLVGPDGRIERVWPKVKPEDHAVEVLAALREARTTPA